jgi:hypothetical protein
MAAIKWRDRERRKKWHFRYIYKHIPTNDTFFDESNNKKGIRYIY